MLADYNQAKGFIDPGLKWADIPWFKSITKGDWGLFSPQLLHNDLLNF